MSAPSGPTVALDGMGGDHAPTEPVRGALAAASDGIQVLLVGDSDVLGDELRRQGGGAHASIRIVHAPEVIGSGEDGARAVRARPESSLVVSCRLVAEGRAGGAVSAGNTGAMMAASTLVLRRLPGVLRPAIAIPVPSRRGPVVLLDAGANADCRPEYYPQFALMGRLLARDVLGIAEPSVGLVSIGEEDAKGSELVQAANALLVGSPGFVGNVEGRDLPLGTVDVMVTDGSTGNVMLKLYEGAGVMLMGEVRAAAASSLRAKLGGLLLRPALRVLGARMDPEEYGGAYLLGVAGLSVIAHGNATGRGIANAVRLAARAIREGTVDRIAAGVKAPREWAVPSGED
ncbi:MAG: phosphate acyltransferase PlsX [Actinobacteria bacterium]|nr:phosphate acyltransferase PlsX [Actinomycetota bacterium]